MDAFEELVSEVFFREGYWTESSIKVHLTKEEKVEIGRPTTPRWEIDVVAYSGAKNELLALECKSFLDSRGVTYQEFIEANTKSKYKLFKEEQTRAVVLNRLVSDLHSKGYIPADCNCRLGLVAGNIANGNLDDLKAHFLENDWLLFSPEWMKERVSEMANSGYSNNVSAVVSKILLRQSKKAAHR